MQVKLFWKNNPMQFATNNARDFEDAINAWLSDNPSIQITNIKQSSSGSAFGALWLISIWYEECVAITLE